MQARLSCSAHRRFRRPGHALRDFNDNFQLGYDAAGRLARTSYGGASSFQFYDLNGQRIFKTDSQSESSFNSQTLAGSINPSTQGVLYQYDQNGNLLFEQLSSGGSTGFLENSTNTHYYWLPTPQGDILVGFDQGINSYAVYTDHLGTPRLVTKIENPQNPKPISDTSNDLPQADYNQPEGISPQAIPVWQWSYSPFGADLANGYEAKPTTLKNNFKPDLWSWMGLPETGGADANQVAQETWRVEQNLATPPVLNIRYPGQYYDFESGLVQNWWRTYEPRIGRYTSADPIGLNGGWNRFAYVGGDGINYSDPMGLFRVADSFPDEAPIVTVGNAYGALAAYIVGVATGDKALATEGMEGLQCSRQSTMEALVFVASMGRGRTSANKAPDFIVSSSGTAFPVPRGAQGLTPVVNPSGRQTGSAYTGGSGGANGQVATMRIMDPAPSRGKSPGYPSGYVKYENNNGQGVNPYTGKTLPNSQSHFPR